MLANRFPIGILPALALLLVLQAAGSSLAQERPSLTSRPAAQDVTGKYAVPTGGDFEVVSSGTGLVLKIPGQADYPMIQTGEGQYRLGRPAPDGFAATFRPGRNILSSLELFLQQPQGDIILARRDNTPLESSAIEYRDLIGAYRNMKGAQGPNDQQVEIASVGGRLAMLVAWQPAYPLVASARDVLQMTGLEPAGGYVLSIRREGGKAFGFSLKQPNGIFEYASASLPPPPLASAEEVRQKMVAALGGETALRTLKTLAEEGELDPSAGSSLQGSAKSWWRAPFFHASELALILPNRPDRAVIRSRSNGKRGTTVATGEKTKAMPASELDWQMVDSPHEPLLWKEMYKSVTLAGTQKFAETDCYVLEKVLKSGRQVREYVSTQTFLPVGYEGKTEVDGKETALSTVRLDWRTVSGLKRNFTTIGTVGPIKVVLRLTSSRPNVPIPDSFFQIK